MIQCSFCNYENEDDTAFCIKCKTDLTIPTPVVSPVARPAAFEPTHTDGDVPTLHLDQIPLVENLGRRSDGSRPAAPAQEAFASNAADRISALTFSPSRRHRLWKRSRQALSPI